MWVLYEHGGLGVQLVENTASMTQAASVRPHGQHWETKQERVHDTPL